MNLRTTLQPEEILARMAWNVVESTKRLGSRRPERLKEVLVFLWGYFLCLCLDVCGSEIAVRSCRAVMGEAMGIYPYIDLPSSRGILCDSHARVVSAGQNPISVQAVRSMGRKGAAYRNLLSRRRSSWDGTDDGARWFSQAEGLNFSPMWSFRRAADGCFDVRERSKEVASPYLTAPTY
ncbi:hypothetical protein SCHPADRAFT_503191 [Schizopora paradoxa]|uniref:Uncharacterized protein n=1 Tax=Schizopora paradoxa TaxID=27342 RepID=A0A0H2RGT1_9AGAM|nr:hypothetical protein SCHPADRAFT_503191 [Schizopora paradoxa]